MIEIPKERSIEISISISYSFFSIFVRYNLFNKHANIPSTSVSKFLYFLLQLALSNRQVIIRDLSFVGLFSDRILGRRAKHLAYRFSDF